MMAAAAVGAGLASVVAPVFSAAASAAQPSSVSPNAVSPNAVSPNATALGQKIAQSADNEIQNSAHNHEQGAYNCNYYSGFFSRGGTSGCPSGFRTEEWCADFAQYTWKAGGANISGTNAAAASFYSYGRSHGTWHGGLSGVQVGDAVVFDLNSSGTYASHVAVVVSVGSNGIYVIAGNSGPSTNQVYKYQITSASGYSVPVA
jgi:hypothetical protein